MRKLICLLCCLQTARSAFDVRVECWAIGRFLRRYSTPVFRLNDFGTVKFVFDVPKVKQSCYHKIQFELTSNVSEVESIAFRWTKCVRMVNCIANWTVDEISDGYSNRPWHVTMQHYLHPDVSNIEWTFHAYSEGIENIERGESESFNIERKVSERKENILSSTDVLFTPRKSDLGNIEPFIYFDVSFLTVSLSNEPFLSFEFLGTNISEVLKISLDDEFCGCDVENVEGLALYSCQAGRRIVGDTTDLLRVVGKSCVTDGISVNYTFTTF
ncbi:unnamed protein product [Dimorphilus gyrociliatus]|uniref:Uncharacterized protein n=1 Tax=Dimorphilus gyrociliatus TaxID=2664684 RepID=A0A7I8VBW0_9ANNE|nr:unnamed protein product [Dimorphilus gyrociliatus]